MSITIIQHKGKYFGQDNEGRLALLRIPSRDGEDEDIGNFKLCNEPQCQWLPLYGDTFPTAFYRPENLFPNWWNDFPELHQVKLMAWDEGIVNDTDGQYVKTLIADCNEITTIFG